MYWRTPHFMITTRRVAHLRALTSLQKFAFPSRLRVTPCSFLSGRQMSENVCILRIPNFRPLCGRNHKKAQTPYFTWILSFFQKQGMRESNSHQRFWRPLSYHLTNPLDRFPAAGCRRNDAVYYKSDYTDVIVTL